MIKFNVQNDSLVIYLSGEIDDFSSQKLREDIDGVILKNSNVNNVVFNFQKVTFMDSTGIGMLIGRYKKLKTLRLKGYISNPSKNAEKLLEISGLYGIMPKI